MNAVQVGYVLGVRGHEGNVKWTKKYSTIKLSAFDECTIEVAQSQSANDPCDWFYVKNIIEKTNWWHIYLRNFQNFNFLGSSNYVFNF